MVIYNIYIYIYYIPGIYIIYIPNPQKHGFANSWSIILSTMSDPTPTFGWPTCNTGHIYTKYIHLYIYIYTVYMIDVLYIWALPCGGHQFCPAQLYRMECVFVAVAVASACSSNRRCLPVGSEYHAHAVFGTPPRCARRTWCYSGQWLFSPA